MLKKNFIYINFLFEKNFLNFCFIVKSALSNMLADDSIQNAILTRKSARLDKPPYTAPLYDVSIFKTIVAYSI